jgi:hypothetical protein
VLPFIALQTGSYRPVHDVASPKAESAEFHNNDSASKICKRARSILNCDNLTFPARWHKETTMAASGLQHLTLDERRSLFRMHEARLGVTEMANLLYMRAFAGASPDQAFVQ